MARVPLVEALGDGDLAQAFAEIAAVRGGTVPNVFRALAHSPGLMRATAGLGATVRFHSRLDPPDRELLILTVARETGCVYEWTHHLGGLLAEGSEATDILAQLDAPGQRVTVVILDIARAIANGETPAPGLVDELRDLAGPQTLVEVLVTAGYYVLLARSMLALDVPLEPGVTALPFPDRRSDV